MNECGDPYFALLELLKKNLKSDGSSFLIGRIVSGDPLRIETGQIPLSRNDVYISDHLLPNYERSVTLDSETRVLKTEDGLKANDRVLILVSADKQTYVVVSKVL